MPCSAVLGDGGGPSGIGGEEGEVVVRGVSRVHLDVDWSGIPPHASLSSRPAFRERE